MNIIVDMNGRVIHIKGKYSVYGWLYDFSSLHL